MTVAVILAGGLGTRLSSVVPNLPKPMAPVNGKPFLELLLTYWADQGISKFVLLVGYMRDVIISYFGSSFRGVPVSYIEESQPLGTGGALLYALDMLTEPFILLNGDTYFDIKLDGLLDFHRCHDSKWTLGLCRANEEKRYGGVILGEGYRVREITNYGCELGELACAGVHLINPSIIRDGDFEIGNTYALEEDLLRSLLRTSGQIYGSEMPGDFLDIGVPKDYFRAANFFRLRAPGLMCHR